jgi:chemotaxis protein methyltransferase CheR
VSPFRAIADLIRAQSGLVLGPDRVYLVDVRLAPLLRREGLRDLGVLAERLRNTSHTPRGAELARQVVEAMTTNETLFFRDERPFTHLREQALPRLHRARQAGRPIRLWSAAASTGQEAYSLAMMVAESRAMIPGRLVEVLGTDLAREPIQRARKGLYTQFEVQRGLPVQMLVRYFEREAMGWRITPEMRAAVEFRVWNLLADLSALGTFDVVFCRNVLIYFDPPTKARVLGAIAGQMAPDGLLYLGGTETTLGLTTDFLPLATERGVYARAQAAREWAA